MTEFHTSNANLAIRGFRGGEMLSPRAYAIRPYKQYTNELKGISSVFSGFNGRRNVSAFSLVEMMIVVVVGSLILLPTIHFLITSQKNAGKGFDRLNTLTTARVLMERVRRDLKALCYDKTHGMRFDTFSSQPSFQFPVFPSQNFLANYSGTKNLANLVTYSFDPQKRTLTRTELIHPILRKSPAKKEVKEILGTNISSFSIKDRPFLGMYYYDIEVVCEIPRSLRKETTHLRCAVRSEYETRLVKNKFQVPNLRSVISFSN